MTAEVRDLPRRPIRALIAGRHAESAACSGRAHSRAGTAPRRDATIARRPAVRAIRTAYGGAAVGTRCKRRHAHGATLILDDEEPLTRVVPAAPRGDGAKNEDGEQGRKDRTTHESSVPPAPALDNSKAAQSGMHQHDAPVRVRRANVAFRRGVGTRESRARAPSRAFPALRSTEDGGALGVSFSAGAAAPRR